MAPLMGPILGLSLGSVLADAKMFYRSLIAESTGMVLVILTGLVVAFIVGPSHIDFLSSEIAGRTRPTLYDLAIGLAAGLAGAYCTVHPGLQASVAGVAIAVALVPPLAVTGLTASGWMAGELAFKPVFGSFMLFFTNLLTIELASGFVFWGTGFRQKRADKPKEVWRKTLVVKAILLLLTGWFLTGQLKNLLQERYGLATSRTVLESMLRDIPGASLDTLEAHLNRGQLTVNAVVGSRTDIEPGTVSRFENKLKKEIKKGLPDMEVILIVRTVNSTFASSSGYLFEPRKTGLDDDERRVQSLDLILRDLLARFPGVDLLSFQPAPSERRKPSNLDTPLTLTLSSPYDFNPRLVKDLEGKLNRELRQESLFSGYSYKLLVKSVIIRNSTSVDAVAVEAPEMKTEEEKAVTKREERLRTLLTSALELNGGVTVTELHLRRTTPLSQQESEETGSPSPTPTPLQEDPDVVHLVDAYLATVILRSPKLVSSAFLKESRDTVESLYAKETGFRLELNLDTSTTIGNDLFLDQTEPEDRHPTDEPSEVTTELTLEERLNQELSATLTALVAKVSGASLDGVTDLQKTGEGEDYRLFAVVTSPKTIENKKIIAWQKSLLKAHPELESLELQVENRLGRTVRLTPIRRQ